MSSTAHLVVTGCSLYDTHFDLEKGNVVAGEKFRLTIHCGLALFLKTMFKDYKANFI